MSALPTGPPSETPAEWKRRVTNEGQDAAAKLRSERVYRKTKFKAAFERLCERFDPSGDVVHGTIVNDFKTCVKLLSERGEGEHIERLWAVTKAALVAEESVSVAAIQNRIEEEGLGDNRRWLFEYSKFLLRNSRAAPRIEVVAQCLPQHSKAVLQMFEGGSILEKLQNSAAMRDALKKLQAGFDASKLERRRNMKQLMWNHLRDEFFREDVNVAFKDCRTDETVELRIRMGDVCTKVEIDTESDTESDVLSLLLDSVEFLETCVNSVSQQGLDATACLKRLHCIAAFLNDNGSEVHANPDKWENTVGEMVALTLKMLPTLSHVTQDLARVVTPLLTELRELSTVVALVTESCLLEFLDGLQVSRVKAEIDRGNTTESGCDSDQSDDETDDDSEDSSEVTKPWKDYLEHRLGSANLDKSKKYKKKFKKGGFDKSAFSASQGFTVVNWNLGLMRFCRARTLAAAILAAVNSELKPAAFVLTRIGSRHLLRQTVAFLNRWFKQLTGSPDDDAWDSVSRDVGQTEQAKREYAGMIWRANTMTRRSCRIIDLQRPDAGFPDADFRQKVKKAKDSKMKTTVQWHNMLKCRFELIENGAVQEADKRTITFALVHLPPYVPKVTTALEDLQRLLMGFCEEEEVDIVVGDFNTRLRKKKLCTNARKHWANLTHDTKKDKIKSAGIRVYDNFYRPGKQEGWDFDEGRARVLDGYLEPDGEYYWLEPLSPCQTLDHYPVAVTLRIANDECAVCGYFFHAENEDSDNKYSGNEDSDSEDSDSKSDDDDSDNRCPACRQR
ncbi:MAG: hypothetical protein MHM6MM_002792 [Cercozoa sp. M6MM]